MLSEPDKEKIRELRRQKFSIQKISEITHFATETVRKVCKEMEMKIMPGYC